MCESSSLNRYRLFCEPACSPMPATVTQSRSGPSRSCHDQAEAAASISLVVGGGRLVVAVVAARGRGLLVTLRGRVRVRPSSVEALALNQLRWLIFDRR